jgi:hypothetical protein
MQKKVLWSSLIILVLILTGLFFAFLPKKTPPPLCEPFLNIAEISKTGDIKSCDCLVDQTKIKQCQSAISNATSYTNALNQNSLTACNNISDIGMKEACISITKAELDFIKQNEAKKVTASTTNKK